MQSRNCLSHGWRVLRDTGFAYFCLNKSKASGRQRQNNLEIIFCQNILLNLHMKTEIFRSSPLCAKNSEKILNPSCNKATPRTSKQQTDSTNAKCCLLSLFLAKVNCVCNTIMMNKMMTMMASPLKLSKKTLF